MAGIVGVKIHDDKARFAAMYDKMFVVFVFCGEVAEDTPFMLRCLNV